MDNSKRGGFRKSLLLLLFSYLTSEQSRFVEAVSDDEYPVLTKSQAIIDDSTDPRTKFVSSLSHLLEQDEDDKRSSSFFPLRGKKIPNNEANIADHYQFLPVPEDKRSQFFPLRGKKIPFDLKRASYFMPMRGRKNDEWDDFSEEENSQDKRASSFMPMRGKKRIDASSDTYQHFGKSGTYDSIKTDITLPSSSGSNRTEVKRMSSFLPVRGRKTDENVSGINETQKEQLRNKRSISFIPIRGRRLLSNSDDKSDSEFPERIVTTLLEKKAYSFMPMRGRRDSLFREAGGTLKNAIDSNQAGKDNTDTFLDSSGGMPSINEEDKRASSFMPMRGRKQDQFYKYFDPLQPDIFEDKRKMSFMPMRGKKDSDDDSHFADLDDKRASSFMPMRGRRTLEIADNTDNDDKRASSFMPMRGRRTSGSLDNIEDGEKRASSFMPMRGRRTSDSLDNIEDGEKRASSFMPMRGRRTLDNLDNIEDGEKRASSFMPMRGRRTLDNLDFNENGEKRASSFMPMRGRRTLDNLDFNDNGEKRASSFMPMRGRRTLDNLDFNENGEKRASSFMPMRGRRALDIADYNGDKRASSFMPMRGRRSISNFGFDDTQSLDDLEKRYSFTPMRGRRLLSDTSDEYKKRVYAFMPMRGRRTSNVNDTNDFFDLDSNEYGIGKRGYAFMPMRGRRWTSDMDQANYYYHSYPFFMPAGIGSALISRPFGNRDLFINSIKAAASKSRRQYDWESVKRAFHATRGKRFQKGYSEDSAENDPEHEDDEADEKIKSDISLIENLRLKRNIYQPQVIQFQPQRKYIALKRPMSFFATRGKRFDDSSSEQISKLP